MPDKSLPRRFHVWCYFILFHVIQDNLQDQLILGNTKCTVRIRYNNMCPARIEARYCLTIFVCSDWKLCFIPIVIGLLHANDRLHDLVKQLFRKAADSQEVVSHLVCFKYQLCLIIKCLNLASATLSVIWASGFCPVR